MISPFRYVYVKNPESSPGKLFYRDEEGGGDKTRTKKIFYKILNSIVNDYYELKNTRISIYSSVCLSFIPP